MATNCTKVRERSPFYVTIDFFDEVGDPLVPSTVEWKLTNPDTGVVIKDWTSLLPPASTMNVALSAQYHEITNEALQVENRALIVRINNGMGSEAHQHFHYQVLNLSETSGAAGT